MPLISRLFARLERAGDTPAHRGPGGLTARGGTARVSVAQRSLRRPVRRQPAVDEAVAQPQQCIEGQVFDVMRVQASGRLAGWKTEMASTNQRPTGGNLGGIRVYVRVHQDARPFQPFQTPAYSSSR